MPSENSPVAVSCCVSPSGRLIVDVDRLSDCKTEGTTLSEPVPDISEVGSVAVIDVTPVVSAVTSPEELTDATPPLEVAQFTALVRSSVVPSESTPVAANCSVSPFGRLAFGTLRISDCSTAETTLNEVVLEISEVGSVAVIVALPVPTAVASPEGDTDTIDGVDVDQVTAPVRSPVEPSENEPVAVSCCDSPLGRLEFGVERLSDWRTAGITSRDFVFEIRDRYVAVTDVTPVVRAVTSPEEDTDATSPLELAHDAASVRFSVVPSESTPVALNCSVSPLGRLELGRVSFNACKTGGSTVTAAVPDRRAPVAVAVIVAAPVPLPATKPCEPAAFDTVATAASELDHVTEAVMFAVVRLE